MHELVIRRAEDRVPCARSEARAVDEALRMFDTKADRERFRFDVHATIKEHTERIACAVADSEDDVVGGDAFATIEHDAAHLAAAVGSDRFVDQHIDHATHEAKFAAEGLNRGAHVLHHFHEAKGADVRLADVHDFVRRARLYEFLKHFAAVVLRVFHLRPEFAVGERTRAALAELHV